MADGPVFPAFLKIEHQADNSAKASFLAEVASFTTDAKRQFERDFGEIRQVINKSLTSFRGGKIALDIDVSGLRQTAAEADLTVQKLRLMRDAATSLASSTGDTSSATQRYLSALRAQVIEAEQAQRVADAQVTTYSRLQAEIDKQVAGNTRLAQSYRDAQIAANLANETYERRGPGPAADMRSGVDRLRDGAASIDRAALSGTTLEQVLGRVSSKSVEVSGALQQARKAEDDLSRATAALRAELDPTVAAQQRMVTQTELLDRALKQGSIDSVEHARLQKLVGEQYELNTIAAQRSVGTQRALRQATLQSGQQLQDIAISLYSGQQASVVFAQQLPQLAFGLSGLEGSANKTHARIGQLATFLSGPWGIAVGLAVGVAGTLIAKMLGVGEEAEDAAKKTYDFSKSIDVLSLSAKEGASAMQQLADATKSAISVQGDFLQNQKVIADKSVSDLESRIASNQRILTALQKEAEANAANPLYVPGYTRMGELKSALSEDRAALALAQQAQANAEIAISQRAVNDQLDAATAATNRYTEAVGQLNAQRLKSKGYEQSGDIIGRSTDPTYISDAEYRRRLNRLTREKDAAVKAAREAEREGRAGQRETATFIDPVSGPITSGFGPRARPTAGASSNHPAIDFGVPVGTAVRAPQVGTVTAIGFDKGLGKYVVIDHGAGTTTRFAHLSDNSIVREGQRVEQGDIIAKSGNTGTSTGPHLDYQVKVNGRPVDPRKRSFPIDAVKTAEAAEKAGRAAAQAEQQLKDFGTSASASIEQINARFDDQPRLIDQATVATTKLNAIISELGDKQPPGFEKLIADAEKAKDTIQDALVRPIQDMAKESQRGLQIQELVLSGREREASVLQRIWEAQRILGDDLQGQEQQVRAIAEAEYDRLEVIKRQTELQSAYLDATRSVRQEVEAILSGQGKFSNFKTIFRNLQGKVLTEQIFGDVFRDLDTWVKRNTGVGRATDEFTRATDRAGASATNFADTLDEASRRVSAAGAVTGPSPITAANDNASLQSSFDSTFGAPLGPNGEIVVTGARKALSRSEKQALKVQIEAPKGTLMAMSPKDYVDGVSAALGARFLDALNATFGTSFFSRFQGVLSGAVAGSVTGGAPGGIIGALKGVEGMPKEFYKVLGKAGEGAATGTAAAGIMKALGIKTSTTGAQIGGALGGLLKNVPGGDIIGSILGGIVGGLFKKAKYGSATIGSVNGVLGVTGTTGNSGQYIKAAGENADSILAGIDRIAQALGATVNASAGAVSIGYYKGKVRVDPTGAGRTKSQVDFGKDGLAAAIQYATLDLIKDGVLTGLRQGTQTLLKNAKDLDSGLQKAVDFEGVFAQLKAIKDPVGAALDGLDKEFVRLKGVFTEAGANAEELASLEELYGLKRVEAVKQANEQIIGSLKSLLADLKTGDMGLSLKDREAAARAAYDPLAARVRAGDVTAAEDFTAAARTLLDIERQIYGSQQPYFNVFNEIKTLSQTMVDTQEAIATASANRDSPFSTTTSAGTDNASVVSAIDNQTSALVSELKAANDNLISILQKLSASGVNLANGIPFGTSF